jgi:hypothetical protein
MANPKIKGYWNTQHIYHADADKYVSPWTGDGEARKVKRNVPGGKMVKWTPKETQKLEDLKADAIEARVSGDNKTAIAKAKEIHDMLQEIRKKKQMRAKKCGRKKACKGVPHVTVSSKEKAAKLGEDLLKRSTKMMGA